jgi:acyl-coenzyme A thioesterase PaaI-like protein
VSSDDFDRALDLRRDGEVFTGELDPGWSIGFAINGGVLLAVMGRALGHVLAEQGHPDPLALSAHYLGAATGGSFEIAAEVVRTGRTVSTAQARLVQPTDQGPAERVRVLATYGDLEALDDGQVRTTAKPPRLPSPEECVRSVNEVPGIDVPLVERLDMRVDPECLGGILGQPTGRGEMQGWVRHTGGREPDVWTLLLALDVFPPVTMNLGVQGWAPTLELTAHVRARPAPGWLRVRAWTDNLAGGLFEENAEVWDSADRLVAQARQLARPGRG